VIFRKKLVNMPYLCIFFKGVSAKPVFVGQDQYAPVKKLRLGVECKNYRNSGRTTGFPVVRPLRLSVFLFENGVDKILSKKHLRVVITKIGWHQKWELLVAPLHKGREKVLFIV
jgi:hypothetical protein